MHFYWREKKKYFVVSNFVRGRIKIIYWYTLKKNKINYIFPELNLENNENFPYPFLNKTKQRMKELMDL